MTNPNNRKFNTRDGHQVARIFCNPLSFSYRLHGLNDWYLCDREGFYSSTLQQHPLDVMGLENFDYEADKKVREALKELP